MLVFRRRLCRPLLLVLLLGLAGCLPHSCSRDASRALLPSDSLSRRLAAQLPVDTMRLAWRATGPAAQPMEHPRTVLFSPAGQLYVGDTGRNSLYVFEADGRFARQITSEAFSYPYLAGFRGDTVVVFNPEARRLDFVAGGRAVHSVPVPGALPERNALQYAAADGAGLFYKVVGDDFDNALYRLDRRGGVAQRYRLPGATWRHAGLLRTWGDSLLSLSGFRPVIDVLSPEGRLDTLALAGFDSPMLARSRSFLLGETHEPPLLAPSAATAGDLLFVLNVRPGWLRVDVFDRAGHLRHIFVQERPQVNRQFYPADLAVRPTGTDRYEIAVLALTPEPHLALYHARLQ